MPASIEPGDCVRLPDGRVARVRDAEDGKWRVRVRRQTTQAHQFLRFSADELEKVECPKGWMSPEGYNRYLEATLAKMRARRRAK
jgi:hypothetical protein